MAWLVCGQYLYFVFVFLFTVVFLWHPLPCISCKFLPPIFFCGRAGDGIAGTWSIIVLCNCISFTGVFVLVWHPLPRISCEFLPPIFFCGRTGDGIVLGGNDARQRDCDMLAGIPQWAAGQH